MKKILQIVITIIFTTGAYAQNDSTKKKIFPPDIDNTRDGLNKDQNNNNENRQQGKNLNQGSNPDLKFKDSKAGKHPDGYMVQNGKTMVWKNGLVNMVENNVTLSNGTIIMTNGTYMEKGGKITLFKTDEHIDLNGKMIPKK